LNPGKGNPKVEARNPKQIQMTEIQTAETLSPVGCSVLNCGLWSFVLVDVPAKAGSGFELRISHFLQESHWSRTFWQVQL
jgi:hypothetical protein